MVHRLTTLGATLIAATLSLCARADGPIVTEMEKDRIREEAQMDIMRHPADTNIEPDLAAVRVIFRRSLSRSPISPVSDIASVRLFRAARTLSGQDLLDLIVKSVKLKFIRRDEVSLSANVTVPDQDLTLKEALTLLESHFPVAFALYADSRLLVMTARR